MDLNDKNLEVFAAKHYRSESCLSKEEFLEDLSRHKLAKKLVKKFAARRSENIRLLCNHVLCFTNSFELSAAKKILMFGLNEKEKEVMKTVLNYFGFLVPSEMPNIKFDLYTAKILKEMDNYGYKTNS
tara:strand:- start:238 stop:621 length:384 start_codon:yes stop_codon:yes gene_type:complete